MDTSATNQNHTRDHLSYRPTLCSHWEDSTWPHMRPRPNPPATMRGPRKSGATFMHRHAPIQAAAHSPPMARVITAVIMSCCHDLWKFLVTTVLSFDLSFGLPAFCSKPTHTITTLRDSMLPASNQITNEAHRMPSQLVYNTLCHRRHPIAPCSPPSEPNSSGPP